MKQPMLSVCIAGSVAVAAASLAFAQVVPRIQGDQTTQLQHVPVSGLHMGPSSQLKNPYEGDRQAWMEGKKLFDSMNCAGCHAPGGGGGMGPALSDKDWIYGSSPGDVYLSILHGRPNGMPQWGTVLPPQAIWALVTYVETLSQPNPEFGPGTKFGAQAGPGNTPHPLGTIQPPPMPKHAKPTPPASKVAPPASSAHPQPPPSSPRSLS